MTKWDILLWTLQRLPLTRALKGFFLQFKPVFWWSSVNRYHGFSRVGLEKIPSSLLEHSEEYVGVSAVFAIFCYKIWHRFMSRLREEYEFVECFQRKLKLSTYLHTVGYNHISFLNTRSQLVWVLASSILGEPGGSPRMASSGFYSITWRMINSKIYFRKQSPFRGNFFPFWCDIFRFFEFILASWQFVHGSRVFIQSSK